MLSVIMYKEIYEVNSSIDYWSSQEYVSQQQHETY